MNKLWGIYFFYLYWSVYWIGKSEVRMFVDNKIVVLVYSGGFDIFCILFWF